MLKVLQISFSKQSKSVELTMAITEEEARLAQVCSLRRCDLIKFPNFSGSLSYQSSRSFCVPKSWRVFLEFFVEAWCPREHPAWSLVYGWQRWGSAFTAQV